MTSIEQKTDQAYEKSRLTAIGRKKLSQPMAFIRANRAELWTGSKLDYGCGRGYDADFLRMDKFDPHYFPDMPGKNYDLVTCNYVLNVLPINLEAGVLMGIAECLNDTGTAFITVRRDVKQDGFTGKKTYQRNVVLPFKQYRLKRHGYEIYETTKQEIKEYCNEN